MNCQVLSTLYVKSNGEIPCECDAGERVTLGWVEGSPAWSLGAVLRGEPHSRIRTALALNRVPWNDVCTSCAFLRPQESIRDELGQNHVAKLQIEPSLHCNLRCPCCSRSRQIVERHQPHVMQPALFERLLRCCADEGYSVDFIEYCGQGEPLTHPDFAGLVGLAREILPHTKQRLITNGNYDYREVMKGERLDEIYVSCDGVRQESYQQYRVNGSVEKAFRFMADARGSHPGPTPLVVWKYILFEFNDSDGELAAAQQKAVELRVDALSLVMTHTAFRSKRFAAEGVEFIPVTSSLTVVNRTPVSSEGTSKGKPLSITDSRLGQFLRHTMCVVDEARLVSGRYLTLSGWAMGKKGEAIVGIRAFADRQEVSESRVGLPRQDVRAAYPELSDFAPGFFLSVSLAHPPAAVVVIRLLLSTAKGTTEEFEVMYGFDPS